MILRECICYIPQYDIKQIRLLWNYEFDKEKKRSYISELIVAPFRYFDDDYNEKNCEEYLEKPYNNYENEHLYNEYKSDWGNCNFDLWQNDSNFLSQLILLKFFFDDKFLNEQKKKEAILECLKIKQMRKPLITFFNLCTNCEKNLIDEARNTDSSK